jgi:hypothetical protein
MQSDLGPYRDILSENQNNDFHERWAVIEAMSGSFVSSKSVCLAKCDFLLTDFFSRQNPSGLPQFSSNRTGKKGNTEAEDRNRGQGEGDCRIGKRKVRI